MNATKKSKPRPLTHNTSWRNGSALAVSQEMRTVCVCQIRREHPVIAQRNRRLGLLNSAPSDFHDWDLEAMGSALAACMPLLMEVSGEGDLSYEVLAGGQFLSSLRLRFGPEFEVWALVVRPKDTQAPTLLRLAAAHAKAGFEGARLCSERHLLALQEDLEAMAHRDAKSQRRRP
jgi:hypothetical protein